jgi:hypothetical protein
LADLYYNRYRDYDPTTGRYIQADPIGLRGGGNPYLYANANPLRFTDPSGRHPILIGMLIGAEIALATELWEHRNEKCWNFNWRRFGTSILTGGALGWAGGFLAGVRLLRRRVAAVPLPRRWGAVAPLPQRRAVVPAPRKGHPALLTNSRPTKQLAPPLSRSWEQV